MENDIKIEEKNGRALRGQRHQGVNQNTIVSLSRRASDTKKGKSNE